MPLEPEALAELECWALTLNGLRLPQSPIAAAFATLAGDPVIGCPNGHKGCDLEVFRSQAPLRPSGKGHDRVMLIKCATCGKGRFVNIMTAGVIAKRAQEIHEARQALAGIIPAIEQEDTP